MHKFFGRDIIFAAAMLSLTQTACVTRGEDFSSDITWVKKGQTSQSEVQKYLGAPFSTGSSGGTETWTYGFYKHSLLDGSKTKELKFYWTPDAKVQDYSFNSSFPKIVVARLRSE